MKSHPPPGAQAPAPRGGEASSWSGPATSPQRLIVGPFNRVEGDLEVRLDVADGRVEAAWVNSPMYRGFEQMLPGRDALDALVIVPRICGICSVSQSIAAAQALAVLTPGAMPPNGRHALNVMHAVENLADHLSHFYLFFLPDFARPVYAGRPWHAEAVRRFAPGAGEAQRAAIAARQRWFTLLGTLGGKWPHTQTIQPGGSARAVDATESLRLLARVREFRAFLEDRLFADRLEAVAALDGPEALQRWRAAAPGRGDARLWLDIAEDLQLHALGSGPRRYLSWGAYAQPDGGFAFADGLLEDGVRQPATPEAVAEDVSHGWYAELGGASPAEAATLPQADKPGAYSWAKAPRYRGRVLETGALARQCLDGQPLVVAEEVRLGGNVYTRVLARLLELARVVPLVEDWLRALRPGEPFHARPAGLPADGRAVGRTEAARGSLAHWIAVKDGRLAHYQIVAPTTWNFSPRDAQGTPGPLEAALVGAPVRPGETVPVAVQHIVRSFDPCMVCTVH